MDKELTKELILILLQLSTIQIVYKAATDGKLSYLWWGAFILSILGMLVNII